jgi:hypothetical protein
MKPTNPTSKNITAITNSLINFSKKANFSSYELMLQKHCILS